MSSTSTSASTSVRTGSITVNTNDILPIIKKWLYSEHDIFLRELVSNSSDAILKRAIIGRTQNLEIPPGRIEVEIDREQKVICVHDNGIGMNEEEVEKYIAKLAFSGAQDFVEKMRNMGADQKEDIIGKFGLGFYSAFMVADKVEIDTLSCSEGAVACKWISEGNIEYTFAPSERTEVGTTITIHVNEESKDFLDKYHTQGVLKKYCDFMPHPIFLKDVEEERLARKEKDDSKDKEGDETIVESAINTTHPLWKKDPTTLKDEDYLAFYREQFPFDPEPLFWIHLKIDHPFELLGVMYFPKLNPNKPINEQNIRLYAKQVFVSDNVKNIIPEFLSLLKGHIDSPDIPLNVSRSSLQGDPNVKKISNYIVKKVADSLKKLFKSDRERYQKIWEDIGLFVKYGCISDEKFDEAMRECVLFKNAKANYVTLGEYRDAIPEKYKEKLKGKILYVEKGKGDLALKRELGNEGIEVVETDSLIDPHFMQQVEFKKESNPDKAEFKFVAATCEVENLLATENSTDVHMKIRDLFNSFVGGGTEAESGKQEEKQESKMDVEVKAFTNCDTPAYYKVDENMKRLQLMTRTMGRGGMHGMDMPLKRTLVVNPNNPLVQNALRLSERQSDGNGHGGHELAGDLCRYIADLASLSSNEGMATSEERDDFIVRSQKLMRNLTDLLK
ncbi:MAG: molecular chaperone HtpG [Oligoflexia bacterium]|nr:molecular chaperone HtpG [Oligoflexia bacterium]